MQPEQAAKHQPVTEGTSGHSHYTGCEQRLNINTGHGQIPENAQGGSLVLASAYSASIFATYHPAARQCPTQLELKILPV